MSSFLLKLTWEAGVESGFLGFFGCRLYLCGIVMQAAVGRHKAALSMFSHTNLALIIWQTLSGARNVLVAQPFHRVALVILASIVMHLIYLAFNAIVIGVFRWETLTCVNPACMLSPQPFVLSCRIRSDSACSSPDQHNNIYKSPNKACMQLQKCCDLDVHAWCHQKLQRLHAFSSCKTYGSC